MNISPVNLVNLKSGLIKNKNEQNFKQKNSAALPVNKNIISDKLPTSYYNYNISFKGNNDSTDDISFSDKEIRNINEFSIYITGEKLSEDNILKLQNGTITPDEMLQILKSKDENDDTIAHKLAKYHPDIYIKATNNLSKKEKYDLLNMSNKKGRSVAYGLIKFRSFLTATEGFSEEEMLNLLKQDNEGTPLVFKIIWYNPDLYTAVARGLSKENRYDLLTTVNGDNDSLAHRLSIAYPKVYLYSVADFSDEKRLNLLKKSNKNGDTPAHNLAQFSPQSYLDATKDFSKEDRLDLLKTANENGVTVAHILIKKPAEYLKATQDFSEDEKIDLLKMSDKFGNIVIQRVIDTHDGTKLLKSTKDLTTLITEFSNDKKFDLLTTENAEGVSFASVLENENPVLLDIIMNLLCTGNKN